MFKHVAAILIGFVLLLALKIPIEQSLLNYDVSVGRSDLLAGLPSRILIVVVIIQLIKNKGFQNLFNLHSPFTVKYLPPVVFTLVIFLLALHANRFTYLEANAIDLIIFLLFSCLVGLAEELVFRNYLFPLIAQYTKKITLAMVISSIAFGLIHYINLYKYPDNFEGITSQVLLATCLGMYFCGLLLTTKNIYIVSVLHALFNISFGSSRLKYINAIDIPEQTTTTDMASIVATLTVFFLIAFSGWLLKRRADNKHFLEQLV